MSDRDNSMDSAALTSRLVDRANDICLRLGRWLEVAVGEAPTALWRDAHGLAGAAGALGERSLAAAAAELALALQDGSGSGVEVVESWGRLSALRDAVAQSASCITCVDMAPIELRAAAWVAIRDTAQAATLQEVLERHGYETQQLIDPAALLTLGDDPLEITDRLLICDFLPDCLAELKAAGWFVIVIDEDGGSEACLQAIRAGADRFLSGSASASALLPILRQRTRSSDAVLVVDDDPLSLDARVGVLRRAGLQVRALGDPARLLESLRESIPDAILVEARIAGLTVEQLFAVLGSTQESLCDSTLLVGCIAGCPCPTLAPDASGTLLTQALIRLGRRSSERVEQERKARAIHKQRQREHQLAESHAIVSWSDLNGVIVHSNEMFCEVSGYSREELVGQNHRIVKSGHHSPEFFAEMWRTISSGQIWRGLICNRRKDGRLYWVLSTIGTYQGEDEAPAGYISIRTDVTELKLLEEGMRLRGRVLEATFNGIIIVDARDSDWPLVTDGELPVAYVNLAFEQITGYSRDEVLGRDLRFLIGDDVEQPGEVELRKAAAEGESAAVVLRTYRKDGTLFWSEICLSPSFDEDGRLVNYIAIMRDVSQRISDEMALRETQENLRETLEATDDGILAEDEQQRTIFYSRRFEELFLLPKTSLQPSNISVLSCDQALSQVKEPQRFLDRLEDIYRHPDQASHDVFERVDGRIIEWDSMPLVRDGLIAGRVWRFKDVTSMHWVQAEMESYQERLRLGQSYANIGTWDWDVVTDDMFFTERVPALYGHPEGELHTSLDRVVTAVHPDDRDSLLGAVNACVEQDVPFNSEHRVIWPDGSIRWLVGRGAAIRDDQGRAVRVIGVVQDIDDRKRAEIELVATREEAERANQAKSEFLSRMSHELRTPMNAVLGFAQLMEYDDTLPEDHVENVHEITRAGKHLLELINEVLDLSKVESGSVDLSIEPVLLCPVVEECLPLIRAMAERRNIAVEHHVCTATMVRADRMRLKQALLNLMSNGIKYNREGGTLTVDVVAVGDGGRVQVRVTDTGRGLRSEEITRIFEPFDRLDIDNSEIEGTGIGLTITRRLVEMMGGNLGVESVFGRGSTFWVELMKDDSLLGAELENYSEKTLRNDVGSIATVAGKTVIYVEDNPSNIRLMAQIMAQRPNVRLLTAHAPRLGIELCLNQQPDLILLDINLPGLDGYQILNILRAEDRLKSVPVIALSANALPKDIDRGRQAGFSDYITKPIQISYFLQVLDRYLGAG